MSNSERSNCMSKRKSTEPSNLNCSSIDLVKVLQTAGNDQAEGQLSQIVQTFCSMLGEILNLMIVDCNGDVIYVNDQKSLFDSFKKAGMVNNNSINLKQSFPTYFSRLNASSVASEEFTLFGQEETPLHVRSLVAPLLLNGEDVTHYIIGSLDVTKIKQTELEFHSLYYTDPLTKLPNRHSFEEDLQSELQKVKTTLTPFALLFLDLDRFKFFNDTLGHVIGDELIISIANRLMDLEQDRIRLYRFGGDEFTFIMKNFNNDNELDELAENILTLFKTPFHIQGNDLMLTSSVGISIYPDSAMSSQGLIESADTAMHYAKERGKDTYQVFSKHMNTTYSEKLKIEAQLRKAIEKQEFFLNYQPQIDMKTKKIIGVEALIRWNNTELGIVAPNEFIPLAEEIGLIDSIGDWVLSTACQQIKTWQEEKDLFIRVGINISPKQFQRPDFVSKVERVLKETGLEAKYVDLEITENGLMQNSLDCLKTLDRLKGHGLKISIDDFGTGYSSLSYLKRFPIDTLKIDQSFVRDLMDDTNDQAIVTSIINLAHNMKLNVIAEGVEKVEIVQFLFNNNCDEMQGYLYSKPLSKDDFENFLDKMEEHKSCLSY